jgi:hypothetical protein
VVASLLTVSLAAASLLVASAPAIAASSSLVDALHADRPAPDRAGKMALHGWLVGRWDMDAVVHKDDGTTHEGRAAKASTRSTRPRSGRASATTANRACAPTTAPTTTPRSPSTPTATGSRFIAASQDTDRGANGSWSTVR